MTAVGQAPRIPVDEFRDRSDDNRFDVKSALPHVLGSPSGEPFDGKPEQGQCSGVLVHPPAGNPGEVFGLVGHGFNSHRHPVEFPWCDVSKMLDESQNGVGEEIAPPAPGGQKGPGHR